MRNIILILLLLSVLILWNKVLKKEKLISKIPLNDDYKEYLKITSKENEEHYVADSGLCITLEELGDRIVTWENFLEKYPNSKLNDKVNNICNSYRRDYILGVPG